MTEHNEGCYTHNPGCICGLDPATCEFTPFPKIARLEKDCVVTEKLDGTNAAVVVNDTGHVYAQSRTRVITPEQDNYGFAAWVADHADDLRYGLGEGIHFGEWWGKGIQRGYGLDEKRFSLFNTGRWSSPYNGDGRCEVSDMDTPTAAGETVCNECPACHVVPRIASHTFSTPFIWALWDKLRVTGSVAAPGFMRPEGVVVFHTGNGTQFKLSDAKAQQDDRLARYDKAQRQPGYGSGSV